MSSAAKAPPAPAKASASEIAGLVAALKPAPAPMPTKKKAKIGLIVAVVLVVVILIIVLVVVLSKNATPPEGCPEKCKSGTCNALGECTCKAECARGGVCDPETGWCRGCENGWGGPSCNDVVAKCDPACVAPAECINGQCVTNIKCSSKCLNNGSCDPSTGSCNCVDGWSGPDCNITPPDRYMLNDACGTELKKARDDWCVKDFGPGWTHVVGENSGSACGQRGKCRYTGDRFWANCVPTNDANNVKHDDWCVNDFGQGWTMVMGGGTKGRCSAGFALGKCRKTG